MPLLAQRNPCCVSVMSTPFLRLMTERLSRRANSITRASSLYCSAHAIDSAEGWIVARSTSRPSGFGNDLVFDDEDVARLQPLAAPVASAASNLSAIESPGPISSARVIGMSRTSRNFARLSHRFGKDCGDSGYTASASVASRSVRQIPTPRQPLRAGFAGKRQAAAAGLADYPRPRRSPAGSTRRRVCQWLARRRDAA